VQELQARILRQEPLDVKKAAQRTAARAVTSLQQDDASVSRHHAVVIDTGTNWVITDLRSDNGVKLRQQRIRGTATLADGDRIGIGGHELTFEIPPPETELPDAV
jgi:SARP family transcriptional regulator, regulator of embCAB operon